jgi:CheY-like chemotaxis protein
MNSVRNAGSWGTVLVVDDDPAVLNLINTILASADYRVLLAGGGEDAIRLAGGKNLNIDVALLDVRMPRVRPAELAKGIRSLRPDIPILFMSGFVEDEAMRIRLIDEYAGFLPKPFRPESLLRAIQLAMGGTRRTRARPTTYCSPPDAAAPLKGARRRRRTRGTVKDRRATSCVGRLRARSMTDRRIFRRRSCSTGRYPRNGGTLHTCKSLDHTGALA